MSRKIRSLLQNLLNSIETEDENMLILRSAIGRVTCSLDHEVKLFNQYIAQARVVYLVHQTGHWITKGPHFFGAHEMFEEMYEDAQERTDEAAEKAIGMFGPDCISHSLQTFFINKLMAKYDKECPFENSLCAENDFLSLNHSLIKYMEENDKMTAGLDDMLPAHASGSEKSIYFLKQSLAQIYKVNKP